MHHNQQPNYNPDESPTVELPTAKHEKSGKALRVVRVIGAAATTGALLLSSYTLLNKGGHEAPAPSQPVAEKYERGSIQTSMSKDVLRDLVTMSSNDFRKQHPDMVSTLEATGTILADLNREHPNGSQVLLVETSEDFLKGNDPEIGADDPLNSSALIGQIADRVNDLAGADGSSMSPSAVFESYEEHDELSVTSPDFRIEVASLPGRDGVDPH